MGLRVSPDIFQEIGRIRDEGRFLGRSSILMAYSVFPNICLRKIRNPAAPWMVKKTRSWMMMDDDG